MAVTHKAAKIALCEQLGLDPGKVFEITIRLTPNEVVTATVRLYADTIDEWIRQDMPPDTVVEIKRD